MNREPVDNRADLIQQAVEELEDLIVARYPGATFSVGPGGEDPEGVYLTAAVDLDDPDEVMDLVINRMVHVQVEQHLPVYVVPVRTPERIERMVQAVRSGTPPHVPPPI